VDPQPGPLRQHQQFGVEEPVGVLDQRQQPLCHIGSHRLEAALGVAERDPEGAAQDEVVAARDELPLGAPDDPRTTRQPGADRDIRMPADQRRQQRQQGGQVGRQVDVHVGDHVGLAGQPGLLQRPSAALRVEVDDADAVQLGRQPLRDRQGVVAGRVVGDGHPVAVRQGIGQERGEPPDRSLQVGRLVVHRDDDLDVGLADGPVASAAGVFGERHRGAHFAAVRS
jgi:hypothetical protein